MASEVLKLTVLTPERRLLLGLNVESVALTGYEGEISILPGHAPMLGNLETGGFSYRSVEGVSTQGVITTGFFEVSKNEVVVLAENLELKGEIDIDRARKAQKRAEDTLKEANIGETDFKKYQLKLFRSLIRQQVAGRTDG